MQYNIFLFFLSCAETGIPLQAPWANVQKTQVKAKDDANVCIIHELYIYLHGYILIGNVKNNHLRRNHAKAQPKGQ